MIWSILAGFVVAWLVLAALVVLAAGLGYLAETLLRICSHDPDALQRAAYEEELQEWRVKLHQIGQPPAPSGATDERKPE